MSVQTSDPDATSAGGAGAAAPAEAPDPAITVAAAQRLLSRWCGAPVGLADPVDLGGSGRSRVLRVRVTDNPFSLPRWLVIKHHGPAEPGSPDTFVHEAASYQLLMSLTWRDWVAPELIAHDAVARMLVLEDLGRSATLADRLLGGDARAAESALLGWARALGRLHATSAGREDDFTVLLRRLGRPRPVDALAGEAKLALDTLPDLLRTELRVPTSAQVLKQACAATRLLGPGGLRAFSPSDVCPDNTVLTSRGVRFLDFEWGCYRDVLLDAAYLRVPFPSCWCVFELPPGMAEAMLAAWRSEVAVVWPELADDEVLLPRLFDAQVLWTWTSTLALLPRGGQPDRPVGKDPATCPRRAQLLVDRWLRLGSAASQAGHTAAAAHAVAVADALRVKFAVGSPPLARYPAFRPSLGPNAAGASTSEARDRTK
jgi:hypothetical protein